jgi:hypothetical protein
MFNTLRQREKAMFRIARFKVKVSLRGHMTLFPFRSVILNPLKDFKDTWHICSQHWVDVQIQYSGWLTSRSKSHLGFKCHMTVCILLGICSWLQCSCFYLGDPFLFAYLFIELLPLYVTINSIFLNFFIIGSTENPEHFSVVQHEWYLKFYGAFLSFLYLVRIFWVGTYIFFITSIFFNWIIWILVPVL